MDLQTIIIYVVGGLLMLIGYFLKDKIETLDSTLTAMALKQEQHEKDDTDYHTKQLESRLDAHAIFVTRAEFNSTVDKIGVKLDSIARDIRDLLTGKADKEK